MDVKRLAIFSVVCALAIVAIALMSHRSDAKERLAIATPPEPAAPQQSNRAVPKNEEGLTYFELNEWPGRSTLTYQGVRATVVRQRTDDEGGTTLRISLTGAGLPKAQFETETVFGFYAGFGRLERGATPTLMVVTSVGSAHTAIYELIAAVDGKWRHVSLGVFDGEVHEDWPGDINGDGRADFVFPDTRFVYLFGAYADGYPPPQIFNVTKGQVVDVSASRQFDDFFEQEMTTAEGECRSGQHNTACVDYVATAARLGRFKEVWPNMLKWYDRDSDALPVQGCRKPGVGILDCAEDDQITPSFPESLRIELRRAGYIE